MIAFQSSRRRIGVGVQAALLACFLVVVACSKESTDLGGDSRQPASFTDPDAARPAPIEAGLTEYCPTNKCPEGFTTCPNSRFPCDVNLKVDKGNCGACGFRCPDNSAREVYACVEGQCVLACDLSTLDCDGVVDNGCEVNAGADNGNCGECGVKCTDPAKPCMDRKIYDYGCGCRGDDLFCPGNGLFKCIDGRADDDNCGACRNRCPPEGDGSPLPINTYRGCSESTCGALKCVAGWLNCDGDIDNGCETRAGTAENCRSCGDSCASGTECMMNAQAYLAFECMCPPGQTLCSKICFGATPDSCIADCRDLSSDNQSCGSCGRACDYSVEHGNEACTFGKCTRTCNQGRADCNGNQGDGCETDTSSDPRNCGGCGIACDGVAGQACVRGRCMLEPCDAVDYDGGLAR